MMTKACHLYGIGLIKVLPFSTLAVLMFELILVLERHDLPPILVTYHLQGIMILAVFLIPVLGMVITTFDQVGKGTYTSSWAVFIYSLKKFLTLMGTILSMLLFPIIMLGILIGCYFALLKLHTPYLYLGLYPILSILLIFLSLNLNFLAPIIALSDDQSVNDAIDASQILVKMKFWTSFIYGLYASLLILFLVLLPTLIHQYFHKMILPPLGLEALRAILLIFIGPWSFAFILTHKFNLQSRIKKKTTTR